ncbi:hypothetical protein RDI58_003841 [Solanum bulbocastanum]|uniref:C3H1-type domain-containing protein n=1 Tax=Solanum bulbocastanum TaxID=147425 RepID=A0AAN8TXX1_SOLBU
MRTIEEEASDVIGSEPKRPHLEDKDNGLASQNGYEEKVEEESKLDDNEQPSEMMEISIKIKCQRKKIFGRRHSCSRGTTCNFIHCFCNPDGDYEWADLDKPPPRYWLTKMAALFRYGDESVYDRRLARKKSEQMLNSYKML